MRSPCHRLSHLPTRQAAFAVWPSCWFRSTLQRPQWLRGALPTLLPAPTRNQNREVKTKPKCDKNSSTCSLVCNWQCWSNCQSIWLSQRWVYLTARTSKPRPVLLKPGRGTAHAVAVVVRYTCTCCFNCVTNYTSPPQLCHKIYVTAERISNATVCSYQVQTNAGFATLSSTRINKR